MSASCGNPLPGSVKPLVEVSSSIGQSSVAIGKEWREDTAAGLVLGLVFSHLAPHLSNSDRTARRAARDGKHNGASMARAAA